MARHVLMKIEERPAYYIDKQVFENEYNMKIEQDVFKSLDLLLNQSRQSVRDFDKLIGHDGSLSDLINQCKATIAYPPDGLPMMLYGPTGTGKVLLPSWHMSMRKIKIY